MMLSKPNDKYWKAYWKAVGDRIHFKGDNW
jgi:hypothetical protein